MDDNQQVLKAVICGCDTVGKTSVLNRLQNNTYTSSVQPTIGVQFVIHSIKNSDGTWIKFQCWDTAGQERFRIISKNYFHGVHVLIFMYDVTSYDTFTELKFWIKESGWGCDGASGLYTSKYSKHCLAYIIGNKIDMKSRQVPFEEAQEYAKGLEMGYIEMSAKSGENVKEGFDSIAEATRIFDKVIAHETNGHETLFARTDALTMTNGNHDNNNSDDEVSVFYNVIKKRGCCCRRKNHNIVII